VHNGYRKAAKPTTIYPESDINLEVANDYTRTQFETLIRKEFKISSTQLLEICCWTDPAEYPVTLYISIIQAARKANDI
jgi:hypothetical protein